MGSGIYLQAALPLQGKTVLHDSVFRRYVGTEPYSGSNHAAAPCWSAPTHLSGLMCPFTHSVHTFAAPPWPDSTCSVLPLCCPAPCLPAGHPGTLSMRAPGMELKGEHPGLTREKTWPRGFQVSNGKQL